MKDTLAILYKFVNKDIWVRCWIDETDDTSFDGFSGGYCYIRVLDIVNNGAIYCTINILPAGDPDGLVEWGPWFDLDEILEDTYTLHINEIDFDVEFDAVTTEELRDMGYQ